MLLFRNTSEAKTHTYYEKEFTSAAQRVDGEILVCLADINNEISKKFAMLLGLDGADYPQVRILDPNPGKHHVLKYVYNQGSDLSRDAIYAFAQDYLEGRLEAFTKSESTPSNRAPGYITPLNADIFD